VDITSFSVHRIKNVVKVVDESGEDLNKIIKEIEQREDIVFLASPDRLRITIGLYRNISQALKLFNMTGSGSLKDKMVDVLKRFILSYKEFGDKELKNADLRRITIGEIFKALNHLKDTMYLTLWCSRRELIKILKSPETEKQAKSYGRHGETDIYTYLKSLEYILSSFNLATSFYITLWERQLFEGTMPVQTKFLRITLPGLLFLDTYANYSVGVIGESELDMRLRDLIAVPKLMLNYVRKTIDNIVEIPLIALARSVAEELENILKTNFMINIPIISNDIVALLSLYEVNKVDLYSLLKKSLIRWKI
jgi:hypothetical protein